MLNSWLLHNCTTGQQSGGGRVLAMAKADCLAEDRLRKKRHRVGEYSTLHSCRASALTRHDAACQGPRKCSSERINTLKYSFILFICFMHVFHSYILFTMQCAYLFGRLRS